MKKSAFIYTPEFEKFHYPPENPFKTERAGMVHNILASMKLLSGENRSERAPIPARRDEMEKFHTKKYLDALQHAGQGHLDLSALHMGIGSSDCPAFVDMYDCAALFSGATLTGARQILEGEADVAFNPSGGFHHAGPERASGFCFVNDVVLACMELADAGKKVLYLDVDLHHGDGVQNAFYERSDVMTISFHESGITQFPGTGFEYEIGIGEGMGYSVNVPLPMGTYDEAYLKAFRSIALPLIESYNPDVIVMELGLDTLNGDPLGHLNLTNNVHVDIIYHMLDFNKPLLATGGGGYNVQNTVRGWALCWTVLCGADSPHDIGAGMGGVMIESTDWQGGLRDRELFPTDELRREVEPVIEAVIKAVKENVFEIHGLEISRE